MKITLEKFGATLISRELGSEAMEGVPVHAVGPAAPGRTGNRFFRRVDAVAVVGGRVFNSLARAVGRTADIAAL